MKKLISLLLIMCIVLSFGFSSTAASISDFSDVPSNQWYFPYVSFVTQKGMFEGTSASTFTPSGAMTRGMFVTVLGRYGNAPATSSGGQFGIILGSDVRMRVGPSTDTAILATLALNTQVEYISTCADTNDPNVNWNYISYKGQKGYIRDDLIGIIGSNFSDVPVDSYYTPYVNWAFTSGIAYETGAGTFSPDKNITREELCSMLYNFANLKNLRLSSLLTAKKFTDSHHVSQTHATAVSKLQQCGVIDGYDDGSFKPQGSATRAEVSAMLTRFVDFVSYKPSSEPSHDANGNYIFGTEVPASNSKDTSYFADAAFIGHSLVVGMKNTFRLPNTDFYAINSSTSKSITTNKTFPLSGTTVNDKGETVPATGTLDNALAEKSYGKVYIMFGANEAGAADYNRNNFYTNMNNLISMVKKSQPRATIYLISMTPVSQTCSESRTDLSRDNILLYNQVIKKLCKDNSAYYLNVFDLIANENGFLNDNASIGDGIHILSQQYQMIKNYLLSHTV